MQENILEKISLNINNISLVDLFSLGFAIGIIIIAFLSIFYDSPKVAKHINKNIIYAFLLGVSIYFMPFISPKTVIMCLLLMILFKINLENIIKLGSFFNIKKLSNLDSSYISHKIFYIILIPFFILLIANSSSINVIYIFYKQLVLLLFGFWMATNIFLRWFIK